MFLLLIYCHGKGQYRKHKNPPPLELKTSAAPPEKYDTVPSMRGWKKGTYKCTQVVNQ